MCQASDGLQKDCLHLYSPVKIVCEIYDNVHMLHIAYLQYSEFPSKILCV